MQEENREHVTFENGNTNAPDYFNDDDQHDVTELQMLPLNVMPFPTSMIEPLARTPSAGTSSFTYDRHEHLQEMTDDTFPKSISRSTALKETIAPQRETQQQSCTHTDITTIHTTLSV